MRARAALPTVMLAVLVLGSACRRDSGEPRLRTERWIEAADEICAGANAELAALEPPAVDPFDEALTAAELDEIADYLERSLEVEADTTRRLDELGLPDDNAGAIEDVLDQREEGRIAVETAIDAARADEGELFAASYRSAVTEYDKASRGAREFGLRECGQ